jgi:TPP-dependent pyruvate/acetoin dehydrogenase alpha subunit
VQRARLASHQVGESAIAAMEDEIDKAIQASVKRASQAPIPAPDRLHAGVFHEKA